MFSVVSESRICDMFSGLFHGEGLGCLVIIAAVFVAGILGILKLFARHRERMAMIERGMHPDCLAEKSPEADGSSAPRPNVD
jgi:hypothetical protein